MDYALEYDRMVEQSNRQIQALGELAGYFTSGNDVPVKSAVIKADDFWKILDNAGLSCIKETRQPDGFCNG